MKKGSKSKCESSSHQLLKEKAKHWVDDLQGICSNLQYARKEAQPTDIAMLEEQMHQMLQEWKAELNEPSPATSLVDGSLGSFSEELARLLQQCEEEDDATSPLEKPVSLKNDPHPPLHASNYMPFQEDCFVNNQQREHGFEGFASASNPYDIVVNKSDIITQLDDHQFSLHGDFEHNMVVHDFNLTAQFDSYQYNLHQDYNHNTSIRNSDLSQFNLHQDLADELFVGAADAKQDGQDYVSNILPDICPPPSAFSRLCALWECCRPAKKIGYCSSSHADLAKNEALPGTTPILRPRGIGLKDDPLYDALIAKTQGMEVGIPMCEGAASNKSPWNAPELFDIDMLEGETVREWLFFDKPRRAFKSGNRKQRSLPDYSGRGWHESRKQVMKEHGGQKRSYYMEPQPLSCHEWHLYEYELYNHDTCALNRLQLKVVDEKKSPRGKLTKESLADLQNKMGRLTANVPADCGVPVMGNTETNSGNIRSSQN
ncbi:transcription factor VOZ1 [Quillaja saponaria]|uniref:Transcription factor VOZ1 n=1 Tax=Quillaja saponaria TaxID=32244 RepID=A0AAD7KYR8_QUISA|nr:transcription factor VOZ1 [Quillaja saponaria]